MTNEELQAHIEAIVATRDAGEIQESCGGNEFRTMLPNTGASGKLLLGGGAYRYRIKPKPREFWVREDAKSPCAADGCDRHEAHTQRPPIAGYIHVREVVE